MFGRRLSYCGVLAACLIGLACDQSPAVRPVPTPRDQTPSEPTPPAVNTAILAGAYALTMEFSSACAVIPELASPRKYEVSLQAATPYPYLGMWITGGGYTAPTVVGDLWPSVDGRSARLTWNNFDFPGCDGIPEPLPNGRALIVCGEGGSTVNERTVVAEMAADVFIEADGQRQKVCAGTRFTFTRVTP
jgi:hypothetical protein